MTEQAPEFIKSEAIKKNEKLRKILRKSAKWKQNETKLWCVRMVVMFRLSVMSNYFATPWTTACQAALPWDFPGKNSGVHCHFFHYGIFPIQGSDLHLLHWQVDYFATETPGEPRNGGKSAIIRDFMIFIKWHINYTSIQRGEKNMTLNQILIYYFKLGYFNIKL